MKRARRHRIAPRCRLLVCAFLALTGSLAATAGTTSLRGSTRSLDLQNREARRHEFTFLSDAEQLRRFVDRAYLVPLESNADFLLHRVAFPFARPEVKLFIERLARQYRSACGERLVVTSLTRPRNRQPWNASPRSVHPTGMAVDLRRPWRRTCRRWLEQVLLSLEHRGVLEATYESGLPHYHVAVFPRQYASYVSRLASRDESLLPTDRYIVLRGDTLWKIAHRHETSVEAVKRANGLRSNRIFPGQVLQLPSAR